jgi:GntR family transcriptional regulator
MTTEWTGARVQPRPTLTNQVVADLRQAIASGAFGSNGQLPSEPTLSQQLGVSRPTVREAIAVLEQEGLVIRRHGLGTFVMSAVVDLPNILNVNTGITDMIRSAGKTPGTRNTVVDTTVADERIAAQLDIDAGTAVAVIERTRTADDRPVALTRDFVRLDHLPGQGLVPERLQSFLEGTESLYSYLSSVGVAVTYGVAHVLPARATGELAKALGLAPDADLLLLEQTDYNSAGAPLVFSEEYLVPGPLTVYVFRRGPG